MFFGMNKDQFAYFVINETIKCQYDLSGDNAVLFVNERINENR